MSNSPELNICSYTGHSRPQTEDLKSPDVIQQVIYKNKEQDHPKTYPWGTPDNTGTRSEAWPSKTTC